MSACTKCAELQAAYDDFQAQSKEFEGELERELEEATKQSESLKDKLAKATAALTAERDSSKASLTSLHAQINLLTSDLAKATASVDQLKAAKRQLEERQTTTEEHLRRAEAAAASAAERADHEAEQHVLLKQELEELKAHSKEQEERTRAEIKDLKSNTKRLEETASAVPSAAVSNAGDSAELAQLQEEIALLTEEKQSLTSDIEEVTTDLTRAQEENEDLMKQVTELKEELTKNKLAAPTHVRTASSISGAPSPRKSVAPAASQSLQADLDTISSLRAELQKVNEQHAQAVGLLQAELSQSKEDLIAANVAAEEKVDEARISAKSLEAQLAASVKKCATIQAQMDIQKTARQTTETTMVASQVELEAKIVDLTRQLAISAKKLSVMDSLLEKEKKNGVEKAEAREKEHAEANAAMKKQLDALTSAAASDNDSAAVISSLKDDLAAVQKELAASQENLADSEASAKQNTTRIAKLEAQVAAAAASPSAKKNEESEAAGLKQQLEKLQDDLKHSQAALEHQSAKLAESEKHLAEAQADLKTSHASVEEATQRADEMQKRLDAQQSEAKAAGEQVKQLTTQLEQARAHATTPNAQDVPASAASTSSSQVNSDEADALRLQLAALTQSHSSLLAEMDTLRAAASSPALVAPSSPSPSSPSTTSSSNPSTPARAGRAHSKSNSKIEQVIVLETALAQAEVKVKEAEAAKVKSAKQLTILATQLAEASKARKAAEEELKKAKKGAAPTATTAAAGGDDATVKTLTVQLDALTSEKQSLESSLSRATSTRQLLESQLAAREAIDQARGMQEKEAEARAEQREREWQARVQKMEQEKAELEQQLAAVSNASKDSPNAAAAVSSPSRQRSPAPPTSGGGHMRTSTSIGSPSSSSSDPANRILDLTASVNQLKKERSALQSQVADLTSQAAQYSEQYLRWEVEKQELRQQLELANQELQVYQPQSSPSAVTLQTPRKSLSESVDLSSSSDALALSPLPPISSPRFDGAASFFASASPPGTAASPRGMNGGGAGPRLSTSAAGTAAGALSPPPSFDLTQTISDRQKSDPAHVAKLQSALQKDLRELKDKLTALGTEGEAAQPTIDALATDVSSSLTLLSTLQHNLVASTDRELDLMGRLQQLKGTNIRVFCRVRPLLPHEIAEQREENLLQYPSEQQVSVRADAAKKNRTRLTDVPTQELESLSSENQAPALYTAFNFDKVFQPQTTQEEVYENVEEMVLPVLNGYRACIFAYGQTGSGKTFTINGSETDLGITFRSLQTLFRGIQNRGVSYKYTVRFSLLELYNEAWSDLLEGAEVGEVVNEEDEPAEEEQEDNGEQEDDASNATDGVAADEPAPAAAAASSASAAPLGKKMKLQVRKGPNGMYVEGASKRSVAGIDEVLTLLQHGSKLRHTESTLMNTQSSRSHLLMLVDVIGVNQATQVTSFGRLSLVDLAGSERLKTSGATGQRAVEAAAINKSLSALADVFTALADGKSKHIPHRNSKLTHLLSDNFSGSSKTLMFVNVSPAIQHAGETLCSLQFAVRARQVRLDRATASLDGWSHKYRTMIENQQASFATREKAYNGQIKQLKQLLKTRDRSLENLQVQLKTASERLAEAQARFDRSEAERLRSYTQLKGGGTIDGSLSTKDKRTEQEEERRWEKMQGEIADYRLKLADLKTQFDLMNNQWKDKYASLESKYKEQVERMRVQRLEWATQKKVPSAYPDEEGGNETNQAEVAALTRQVALLELEVKRLKLARAGTMKAAQSASGTLTMKSPRKPPAATHSHTGSRELSSMTSWKAGELASLREQLAITVAEKSSSTTGSVVDDSTATGESSPLASPSERASYQANSNVPSVVGSPSADASVPDPLASPTPAAFTAPSVSSTATPVALITPAASPTSSSTTSALAAAKAASQAALERARELQRKASGEITAPLAEAKPAPAAAPAAAAAPPAAEPKQETTPSKLPASEVKKPRTSMLPPPKSIAHAAAAPASSSSAVANLRARAAAVAASKKPATSAVASPALTAAAPAAAKVEPALNLESGAEAETKPAAAAPKRTSASHARTSSSSSSGGASSSSAAKASPYAQPLPVPSSLKRPAPGATSAAALASAGGSGLSGAKSASSGGATIVKPLKVSAIKAGTNSFGFAAAPPAQSEWEAASASSAANGSHAPPKSGLRPPSQVPHAAVKK